MSGKENSDLERIKDMERYKIIAKIEYKGKLFYILTNKYYNKYFLRIMEDESVMYPTLEEYLELDRIFNNNFLINLNYLISPIKYVREKVRDKRLRTSLQVYT